jgi:hypothetical protein
MNEYGSAITVCETAHPALLVAKASRIETRVTPITTTPTKTHAIHRRWRHHHAVASLPDRDINLLLLLVEA